MSGKRWKVHELRVCRMFGGERSGPTGATGCDCTREAAYAIQHKLGYGGWQLPAKWLTQATRDAEGDPRDWLLVQTIAKQGVKAVDLCTLTGGAWLRLTRAAGVPTLDTFEVVEAAHGEFSALRIRRALDELDGRPWLHLHRATLGPGIVGVPLVSTLAPTLLELTIAAGRLPAPDTTRKG